MGETSYGRIMRLKEKLQILMARHSHNGQKLAKLSQVSDSEISRILQGKSRPGLDNAFRLAQMIRPDIADRVNPLGLWDLHFVRAMHEAAKDK